MESAGVSGTVIITDYMAEIHGALSEVCSEFTVDQSMVSCWTNRFCGVEHRQ